MKVLLAILIALTNANVKANAMVFTITNDKAIFLNSSFMISDLVKTYASLEKMNVVFDADYKDAEITVTGEKNLSTAALELYITSMLSQAGYTMKILPETKTLTIFSTRDIRFNIAATYSNIDQVPDTYAYAQFMYTLKHVPAHVLLSNLRPFTSRYGRIIEQANILIFADTRIHIRRIMQIIQELDTPTYLKSMEEVKEINEKNMKITEKKKSFLEILNDNNVIFLLIFSLIGVIIGFGIRGFAMKRIEGGW